MNDSRLWTFTPFDTWFFRESRPFESAGGTELSSVFPPPMRTLAGAIRTTIGEHAGVDWSHFQEGEKYAELREQIGDANGLGERLKLQGPILLLEETPTNGKGNTTTKRLYPVPRFLLAKRDEQAGTYEFARLKPGEPVHCDLGESVCLPVKREADKDREGVKPLDGAWIDVEQFQCVLAGGNPAEDAIIRQCDLLAEEPRLGIARNNASRTATDRMLYQTRHVRLGPRTVNDKLLRTLSIGAIVAGIGAEYHPDSSTQCKLGGEGRLAGVEVSNVPGDLLAEPPSTVPNAAKGLLLVIVTPARFEDDEAKPLWHPPGFTEGTSDTSDKEHSVWRGSLEGVELEIVSAALGKPLFEGGWDVAQGKPRPLVPLVPPGSTYFVRVADGTDLKEAAKKLHGAHIGSETEFGRGEIAVGYW